MKVTSHIACEVCSLHGIKSPVPLPAPSSTLTFLPRCWLHGHADTHLATPLRMISFPYGRSPPHTRVREPHTPLPHVPAMSTNSTASSATSSALGHLTDRLIVVATYTTIVVCSHVPIILELKHPNFHKWAPFFKSLLGKFGLRNHIDGTVPTNTNDPQWVRSWTIPASTIGFLDPSPPTSRTSP
jgi:hypothetical protein